MREVSQTEVDPAYQSPEQSVVDNVELQDGSNSTLEEVQRLHTRNRWLTRVLSELDIKVVIRETEQDFVRARCQFDLHIDLLFFGCESSRLRT